MKPTRRAIGGMMGALALMATSAWGQAAGSGTVKGSVVRNGAAVAGAKVVLVSLVSNFKPTAVTDQQGACSFAHVPLGGLELRVLGPNGTVIGSVKGTLTKQDEIVELVVTLS